jgi:hypothetical protein
MPQADHRLDQHLEAWRRDLIDLSRRNRLINLPVGGRGNVVQIITPTFGEVLKGFSRNKQNGWRFHYPPIDPEEFAEDQSLLDVLIAEDPDLTAEVQRDELLTDVASATKLSTRLRTLATKASSEFIDRGLRVLYITVGMLEWSDGDPTPLASPLVLVPVQLDRASPRDPYRLRDAEEDWVANPALAAKLEREFDFVLPEFDPDGVDGYLDEVRKQVHHRGWTVTPTCCLATLSFSKETIYRDLVDNEDYIIQSPVIRAIVLGGDERATLDFDPIPANSELLDQTHPPETLTSILDADGTQRACIVAAKQGHSFVMDGPPGSGKSQTIANVIAELLGDGKTVLFVSEKIAALDVVKNRLDQAHLGEFVLEVHSHSASRKAVAQQLGASSRHRFEVSRSRQINERQLAEKRRELSGYAAAINEPRHLTTEIANLHDAIGRASQLAHLPSVPAPKGIGSTLTAETFSAIIGAAQRLADAWGPVKRGVDFLWRDLTAACTDASAAHTAALVDEALRSTTFLIGHLEEFCDSLSIAVPSDAAHITNLAVLSELLGIRPRLHRDWLTNADISTFTAQAERLAGLVARASECDVHLTKKGFVPGSVPLTLDALRNAVSAVSPLCSEHTTLQQVEAALTASQRVAAAAADLAAEVTIGTKLLGVKIAAPTAEIAASLLELIGLGHETHRPVDSWLDPAGVRQVHAAIRSVQPLVEEWRATEERLGTHFNDNVRTVDIESFFDSPTDVQPKLGRASGRGRRNRRQLQACTVTGKITKDVVALMPVVRAWRNLTTRLNSLDEAEVLGDYFAGPATDLDAVRSALATAERALVLAGASPDTTRLSKLIGRDAIMRADVIAHRDRLTELHGRWNDASTPKDLLRPPAPSDPLEVTVAEHERIAGLARTVIDEMLPFTRGDTATFHSALAVAQHASERASLRQQVIDSPWGPPLSPIFAGVDTDWVELSTALRWADAVRQNLGHPVSHVTAEALMAVPRNTEFETALHKMRVATLPLHDLFAPPQQGLIAEMLEGSPTDCIDLLTALGATSADIVEWKAHVTARDVMLSHGLGNLFNFMVNEQFPAHNIVELTERTVLDGWITELLTSDSRTQATRRQDRDEILKKFRELDAGLRAQAAAKVITACSARRPTAISGEFQILEREANKSRRHMPVRELLDKTASAALDLKPCFMMSPLSVSQFLPPTMRFDCVIFDEASQVKPADAVNAIYRGRQVIIAGDERQLPPTSFFDKGVEDDDVYDEEEVDHFESVLGLAKSGITQLPLRWHYRSRHESLISFSNREFYESELVTYPGAIHESPDLGIHFEHVPDGVYARGASKDNLIEARRVVERILHHAIAHPDLSVGVIAFSDAQASRIANELEAQRRLRPDIDSYFTENRLDGFFIKNIESVQGDERDIIIFSIGYGRDEFGKFTMNFGPVGQEGGQRRLNVAVTRARQRVEVVASIRAADFPDTTNPRIRSLKKYLDYAERGVLAFADDGPLDRGPESPFEEEVIAAITDLGFHARPQVGQAGFRIDIGVVHPSEPGRYALGVECDGASYHSSRVARDRDRLRQEVLEGLGWRIHRIWSTSWFTDRRGEIERLRKVITAAVSAEQAAFTTATPIQLPEPERMDLVEEIAPWATPFSIDEVRNVLPISGFNDSTSGRMVREVVSQIVEILQPVHCEQIEQAIKISQQFTVMTAPRKVIVQTALAALVRSGGLVQDRFGFYWRPDAEYVSVRSGDADRPDSVRKPPHVSPDEVKLAMFWLARDARSIQQEALMTQTARLFGWQRNGNGVRELLAEAFTELIDHSDLVELDDGRVTAEDREVPHLG